MGHLCAKSVTRNDTNKAEGMLLAVTEKNETRRVSSSSNLSAFFFLYNGFINDLF